MPQTYPLFKISVVVDIEIAENKPKKINFINKSKIKN